MKGGFNKILRNIVAGSSDTEYEKRLTKATFHLDSKEPKEKHVIYLLESLNGEHKDEVSPIGALKFILERHISNLDNWAITSKVFIILHRALQNKRVNRKVIRDLKKNEHLLHPYQKKNPDNKYNIRMFMEISKQYSVYIKYYMNTCLKTEILTKPRKGFGEEVRKLNISEILKNYEFFEGLSTQIFDLFQHTNFCKQTRLFSNVIFMLLKDLMEIYRIYYTHITELLERFPSLAKRDAQKAFVMYQNFVNLTEAIKSKANKLIYIFNFPITLPDFYNPERGLIDTLRVVVTSAASSSTGRETEEKMNQISSKLRSGMNREQFEKEEKKGEDLDAIADMYFDCNALDRIDENANAPAADAMAFDPTEEIKMDKDLGLFEMINAGDFATVQGSGELVAADEGNNTGQKQTFDFGEYNQEQEQKAATGSQIVDDIFGDSGQQLGAAQESTPASEPASAQNDLMDIFGVDNGAKNGAAGGNQNAALNDIFAAGNQALAPKVNEMPGQDKYSQLNSFYQQESAQSSAQQFQTQQQLSNSDPFSQLMGGQQNNNRGGSFASGQPASGGFQPMAQPAGFQPMMGHPQMGAGMGGMGGMGMMTNQPQAAGPLGGMNPFAAFEAAPQQDNRNMGFGTAPPQQQQQQQNQQNDPFNAFNF